MVKRWASDFWETLVFTLLPISLLLGALTFGLYGALSAVLIIVILGFIVWKLITELEWALQTPRPLTAGERKRDAMAARLLPICIVAVLAIVYVTVGL